MAGAARQAGGKGAARWVRGTGRQAHSLGGHQGIAAAGQQVGVLGRAGRLSRALIDASLGSLMVERRQDNTMTQRD